MANDAFWKWVYFASAAGFSESASFYGFAGVYAESAVRWTGEEGVRRMWF